MAPLRPLHSRAVSCLVLQDSATSWSGMAPVGGQTWGLLDGRAALVVALGWPTPLSGGKSLPKFLAPTAVNVLHFP